MAGKMTKLEKFGIGAGIAASAVAIVGGIHDIATKKKQIKYKAECDAYYQDKIRKQNEAEAKAKKAAAKKTTSKKNVETKKSENVNKEEKK